MMKANPFRTRPDILERREGGGCLSLFGIPFLLAGLFLMQIPLGIIPVNTDEAPMPWYFFVLFGLPFTLAGGFLVFGRKGTTIDHGAGRVYRWWGLLVPMRIKSYPLGLYSRVRFGKNEGDSDSATTWPVSLVGEGYGESIDIYSPTDYAEARRVAEEAARLLKLPLEDMSGGRKTVRDPDKLDEPLRERIRRTGEDATHLPEPPGMTAVVGSTGNGYVISIPEPHATKKSGLNIFLSIVFGLIVGWFFLRPFSTLPAPDFIRYIFGGFLILFMLAPLLSALNGFLLRRTRMTIVSVNPAVLRIEERCGRKSSVMEMPADDIVDIVLPTKKTLLEEMEYPGKKKAQPLGDTGIPRMPDGRRVPRTLLFFMRHAPAAGITAVGVNNTYTFGAGLTEPELAYIHSLIRKTIAGQ